MQKQTKKEKNIASVQVKCKKCQQGEMKVEEAREMDMCEALELVGGALEPWQDNGDECQLVSGKCKGLRCGEAEAIS